MDQSLQGPPAATTGNPQVRPTWSFAKDGPPLWLVAAVFALLLAVWLAPGSPAAAAIILLGAALATMALERRSWVPVDDGDTRQALAHSSSLRQRLDEARARQTERNRWRAA